MHRLRKIKEKFGSLLFLAGLISIIAYVFGNFHEIFHVFSSVNIYLFFLSVLFLIAYNLLVSLLFWRILTRLGFAVKAGRVTRTLLLSQIAKYVPGKVWIVFFQKSSFRNQIPISSLTLANIYFIFLAFVLIFCIGLTTLLLIVDQLFIFPAIIFGGAGFILIQKTNFFWSMLGGILKSQPEWHLERNFIKSQALLYPLIVATYILAHYSLIQSLYDLDTNTTLLIITTLALSWALSSLVVVIPSGIILREFIFFAITSYTAPTIDYAIVASIAVSSRFWLISADIFGATATLIYSAVSKATTHE